MTQGPGICRTISIEDFRVRLKMICRFSFQSQRAITAARCGRSGSKLQLGGGSGGQVLCSSFMVLIPHNATDDAVLDIIRKWIDVLAKEDYEAVVAELGPGLDFAYGSYSSKAECLR